MPNEQMLLENGAARLAQRRFPQTFSLLKNTASWTCTKVMDACAHVKIGRQYHVWKMDRSRKPLHVPVSFH